MNLAKKLLGALFWLVICLGDGIPMGSKKTSYYILGIIEWLVLIGIFLLLFFLIWPETWWMALVVTLGGYLGFVFVIALVGVIHDLITRSSQKNEEYRHQEEN